MIIQCENCRRKYRLDDSKISPPGSSVKCSKCGHIFFASKSGASHNEDKPVLPEETALFEELKEESTEEITTAEEGSEHHEDQEAIFEAPSELAQSELSIVEDIVDDARELDNDIIDIPTEHQSDLEDFIDQDITENAETDIESEDLPINENEGAEKDLEISKIEEPADSVEDPPELFESEENLDNKLADNEFHQEVYSDKSFEEESDDDEKSVHNTETLSIDEPSLDEETQIIEQVEQEDLEETKDDITDKTSRGKIIKSNTNILTRVIYTLITIAALFIIFIASFAILIKAEILPKASLPSLTTFVESIVPLELNEDKTPKIIVSEHKARWMNTVNGPVYIVSGLVTNESQTPVHYIKLRSEYIAADKKEFEDTFYAGNTFTDVQLKVSPIQNILSKLDQKNGDIDINNSKKLAGLNYNIQPGESIPFVTVFPADGRVLGLKYKLEVIDYQEAPSN